MPTYFTSCKPRDLSLPRRNLPPRRSLFKSENIFNQFGTFFPQPETRLGFYRAAKQKTMENQEEKETSLEYFYDKVLDASEFYESEYKAIIDALNEAKKMYDEEIAKAYMKGKMDFKNQAIAFYEDKINMAYKEGWFAGAENFNPNKNK